MNNYEPIDLTKYLAEVKTSNAVITDIVNTARKNKGEQIASLNGNPFVLAWESEEKITPLYASWKAIEYTSVSLIENKVPALCNTPESIKSNKDYLDAVSERIKYVIRGALQLAYLEYKTIEDGNISRKDIPIITIEMQADNFNAGRSDLLTMYPTKIKFTKSKPNKVKGQTLYSSFEFFIDAANGSITATETVNPLKVPHFSEHVISYMENCVGYILAEIQKAYGLDSNNSNATSVAGAKPKKKLSLEELVAMKGL